MVAELALVYGKLSRIVPYAKSDVGLQRFNLDNTPNLSHTRKHRNSSRVCYSFNAPSMGSIAIQ